MSSNRLFKPLKIGNVVVKHRIPMAPLTRFRSDSQYVPGQYMKEYYEQRGSVAGTLLITEATFIAKEAGGYRNVPGIWSQAQIDAWKEITDAVHAKGSFIYCQLWALGRVATPDVLAEDGFPILSSSDVPIAGLTSTGTKPGKPSAMSQEQIRHFVGLYAKAAQNAIEAGFDGVEIHGANGYLVDQFTQDVSNKRTDEYGGSIEKRARFGLEVTKAVVDAVGKERVGIRLAPWYDGQGMGMKEPIPQYLYLTQKLRDLDLAYLHLCEKRTGGTGPGDAEYEAITDDNKELIEAWCQGGRPILLAGGFTPEKASRLLNEVSPSKDICTVFGRYFIANPDLVFRIQKGIELSKWNRKTFYKTESPEGYIDLPFSKEWASNESRL